MDTEPFLNYTIHYPEREQGKAIRPFNWQHMYTHYDFSMNREITTILPGEYFSAAGNSVICTVLGSCISVALFDPAGKTGGLNHFMLPGKEITGTDQFFLTSAGRYGIHAMELLINGLVKLGSRREKLVAKVFGGGSVLPSSRGKGDNVAKTNISFAFTYLETEGIPVEASDVGGIKARKIFLFTDTGKVLVKRIGSRTAETIEEKEMGYGREVRKKIETGFAGPVDVFDHGDPGNPQD